MAVLEQGAVVAAKYRLEREISHGGMGSVWLGHHLHLDVPIAIKFMRTSLAENAGARSRFEREAKAAALIRSPHVVHIYDHGIDDNDPFIVMEYLEGQDLRHRLKGKRRVPPSEAIRICKEVCKGLHRAHGRGIVHRDLKPGNIWLSEPDDDMVKLLDFGIAKETGEDRMVHGETTTSGQLLGSPHYMSPEQARGQDLDGRSDLWSLAVIMFRALTGRRPFDGDDIGDLIVRICMDPVPPVSKIVPALGPQVDAFFAKAFDRSPDNRYQDARSFAAAFEEAMSGARSAEDSASWDRVSTQFGGSASIDDATPSTGSSKFGNAFGPMDQAHSGIGVDTFAATAGPAQKRRRLLGGVIAAIGAGVVIGVVLLTSPKDTPAPASTAEPPATEQTSAGTVKAEPPPIPTATVAAEPSAAPSTSASTDNAPKPVTRRRPVRRPAAPVPAPAATPKPKTKPKNPFGY